MATIATIPIPIWHRLRERGARAPRASVHELTGCDRADVFARVCRIPDRPHFSRVRLRGVRLRPIRDAEVFASSPGPVDFDNGPLNDRRTACCPWAAPSTSRYRTLGATVVRSGQRQVVDRKTGSTRRSTCSSTDSFGDGRAELNVDFCAAIPMLTITGSFGVPVEQALDIRDALSQEPQKVVDIISADRGRARRTAARRPRQRARAG